AFTAFTAVTAFAAFATFAALAGLRVARFLFLASLRHQRRLRDRFLARNDEMAQHGVAEAERADELVERRLVALDVEQQVVRLVHLLDGMGELPSAPVLLPMDLAAGALDHVSIALHHGRHLLALVRVDQKHDFVVSQTTLPSGKSLPTTR